MKGQTFEDYLKEMHAEDYHGTDDDMPDSFDAWLGELDGEEYCKFAEAYGAKQYHAGKLAGLDRAIEVIKQG